MTLPTGLALGGIGDDLTGTNVTSAQFLSAGLPVITSSLVPPPLEAVRNAGILFLNTDSRLVDAGTAYRRVRAAARFLLDAGAPVIFKFHDTGLRGNLGAEIDAVLDEAGVASCVLAPAQVSSNIMLVGGYHISQGRPTSETERAREALNPVRESYMPALLTAQSRRPIRLVPLSAVVAGPDLLAEELATQAARGGIVLADAATSAHVAAIARAAVAASLGPVFAGSCSFARELCGALRLDRAAARTLIMAGSPAPTTRRQLDRLHATGVPIVQLDVAAVAVAETREDAIAAAVQATLDYLGEGGKAAICVPPRAAEAVPSVPADEVRAAAGQVASALAEAAQRLVAAAGVRRLIIAGGDTAMHVTRELGIRALRIHREDPPWCTHSTAAGGPHDGLRLVTKGGSAGPDDALVALLAMPD